MHSRIIMVLGVTLKAPFLAKRPTRRPTKLTKDALSF